MQTLALIAGLVVGAVAVLLHMLVWRGRLGAAPDRHAAGAPHPAADDHAGDGRP